MSHLPDVLAEIRNFRSAKLKKVQTKVVTPDGRQLIESRDRNGYITSKETGKGLQGFVADIKPDLEVAEILPGLTLGSQDVANDLNTLQSNKITHILNLASGVKNNFGDKFVFKSVELLDVPETNIRDVFDECFAFIDEARKNKGTILVHCNAGVSRAASIVIAYLMKTEGVRFKQAFETVRSKRASAKPNDGFLKQLEKYDQELQNAKVTPSQPPNQKSEVAQPQQPNQKMEVAQSQPPNQKIEVAQPQQPNQKVEVVQPQQPNQKVEVVQPQQPKCEVAPTQPLNQKSEVVPAQPSNQKSEITINITSQAGPKPQPVVHTIQVVQETKRAPEPPKGKAQVEEEEEDEEEETEEEETEEEDE